MGQHVTVAAFPVAVFMHPNPSCAATVASKRFGHEIGKAPGCLCHDSQGHSSGFPMNRDHSRERQSDGIGMGGRRYKIADMGSAKGMTFAVCTVACAPSAGAARQIDLPPLERSKS